MPMFKDSQGREWPVREFTTATLVECEDHDLNILANYTGRPTRFVVTGARGLYFLCVPPERRDEVTMDDWMAAIPTERLVEAATLFFGALKPFSQRLNAKATPATGRPARASRSGKASTP